MSNRDKSTLAAASEVAPGSVLTVVAQPGDSDEATMAKFVTRPTVQASITANMLLGPQFEEQSLNELIGALSAQVSKTRDNDDLCHVEEMLISQSQTLDLLFNKLTRVAVANIGSFPDAVALYLKLALRAQSQCRAIAETLHEMKHPKSVAFFQQANIANGPQQVNNGPPRNPHGSRAGENKNVPKELLEGMRDDERLDNRATKSTEASDQSMATLDARNRAPNRGGEESFEPQRLEGWQPSHAATFG